MGNSRRTSHARGSSASGTIGWRVLLLILIAGWVFLAGSLIGFDPADPPSHMRWPVNSTPTNWCGPFGAFLSYHMIRLVGAGAYVLVGLIGLGLLSAAVGQAVRHPIVRVLGLVLLTCAVGCLQNLLFPRSGPMPDLAGGLIGKVGTHELAARFGNLGSAIVLLLGALIGLIVAMDEWVIAAASWSWRWTRDRGVPVAMAVGQKAGSVAGDATVAAGSVAARASGSLWSRMMLWARGHSANLKQREHDLDGDIRIRRDRTCKGRERKDQTGTLKTVIQGDVPPEGVIDPDVEAAALDEEIPVASAVEVKSNKGRKAAKPAESAADNTDGNTENEPAEKEDEDVPGAPQVFNADELRAKMQKLPIVFGQQNKQIATDADLAALQGADDGAEFLGPDGQPAGKQYQFPGLDLLENPEENFSEVLKKHVEEQGALLVAALMEYKIDGRVVDAESGPVITMYNVKLAPGTKVAALQAVASDIARSLKAVNIRIVPNTAGRDTIGIEVPNTTKEKVRLKELMSQTELFSKMRLPMFLGKDASGSPLIQDLAKMPHMLIAGTTGSGKSVCMNTIIMGFLYTKRPSELKLVLVDPKMVEMSQFKDIPHLMCPVVTEMPKAAAILEWACTKMEERYELLAEAGCRDIAGYNELDWDELKQRLNAKTPEEEAKIPKKLPYMVIVVDELADLMMTVREVETFIIRIAQKARAVGIHLILATQRPQREVVTGLIKANMPARLTFKVASGMDSRIVLDQKGGELLLGQGDMLFLTPSSSTLTRAQGTLVDDREIRRVVKFMREVAAPSFERQLVQLRSLGQVPQSDEDRVLASQNNSSASLQAAQEDPMFHRAVEIVLETKRGSVSLLQRRLAIGYTRSSRLIDLMGIAGIISDHKGSVARDVLISLEEWEAMKKLAAEEARSKGIEVPGFTTQSELFDADAPVEIGDDIEPDAEVDGTRSVDIQEEPPFDSGDAGKPVSASRHADMAGNEDETL